MILFNFSMFSGRTSGGGIAPRPVSGQGSGAARALARFSQSNAPATNTLLSDRSARASLASRTIAAKFVSTMNYIKI